MREILFRGKDIAGNWHYGVPLIFTGDYVCMTAPHTYNKAVIPETVGQYTGLTDKNGTKIFEGDIVAWNNGEMDVDGKYFDDELFLVKFSSRTFGFVKNYGTKYLEETLEGDTGKDLTVIGHIYDNPELLKPSLKPEYRDGDPDCPICPNCRTPLNEMEDCDCGQKIDWSEEE